MDKILETALAGEVHRKLSFESTIVYAATQEHVRTIKTNEDKGRKGTSKHNRRQQYRY